MSRKLLNLAYIYEILGKHEEALVLLEQVLEKDSRSLSASLMKEARIGIKANQLAIKYAKNPELIKKNLNYPLLEAKIATFRADPKNLMGWFSQWN